MRFFVLSWPPKSSMQHVEQLLLAEDRALLLREDELAEQVVAGALPPGGDHAAEIVLQLGHGALSAPPAISSTSAGPRQGSR